MFEILPAGRKFAILENGETLCYLKSRADCVAWIATIEKGRAEDIEFAKARKFWQLGRVHEYLVKRAARPLNRQLAFDL